MKALITAGGRGTRLRPLTHTRNKHLIPVANKPMIHYAIEAMAAAGIKDIGISINPDTGAALQAAVGDGEAWGVRLTYIVQEEPLGLAHVVRVAEPFLRGDRFVFYLGDNLIGGGVQRLIERFEASMDDCHLVLARVRELQRFGVAEVHDGRVVGVEEKPSQPKSDLAVTGIYCYTEAIFEAVHAIRPSARGEFEISEAHQYLIDHGYRVSCSEVVGWWKDTGKPEDLLEANRMVLDTLLPGPDPDLQGEVDARSDVAGKVLIAPGGRVVASQIRGPAIIGAQTIVQQSYIGPYTALGADCLIRNSEVEYSIICPGVQILDANVRIERSLLGREVIIRRGLSRPTTQQFIIGDQSIIELA
jgi:glucose-1-phosphate thymidylyltransferase